MLKAKSKFSIAMIAIIITACIAISVLSGCNFGGTTITITGSSSVYPLMQALAAEYEKTNDVTVKVTMSDSTTGITDTVNGRNDIGMASRDIKSSETGVKATKICIDGVIVIANKESDITNVTSQQLFDLFVNGTAIGSVTGGISREEGSGTRDAFDSLIKSGSGEKLSDKESFASVIDIQNSTGYVMTEIVSNASKIGYISLGSLNDTVKALTFNGVEGNVENIKSGTYTLSRPFNIVTKEGNVSEEVQKFIDFILSDKGQQIVVEKGYISIL